MAEFKNELILQDGSGNKVAIDLRNALVLTSAPTTATKARVGMLAYVVAGNKITEEYVCTAVSGSTYTWVLREIDGAASVEVDATLTKPGKAADAAATGAALDGKADKGDVYEYVDDAPQFTNMLEADGLTTKIRVDISSGEVLSSDAWTYISTTGYIPCKHGDVIRVNDDFQLDTGGSYYVFALYDKDKNYKTGASLGSIISNTNAEPVLNDAGNLVQFKLCWTGSTAYIRISNHNKIMGSNPVLTVNEEIKYASGYGTMLNSGLKIRQRQIIDAPVRNCYSILPNDHIAIAYSSIGRKPINTVEHFTDAAENFGYNALKCDLQPTSDGELVCCHDEGFTFNADGYITTYDSNNQTLIHDVTAAACLGYSFRTGEHPCLVGDYLNVCRKYGKVAFITIRADYMDVVIPKLLSELKKHNMMYSTIINSMEYNSLVEWRKRDQTVMINYTMYHKLDLTESYIDRAVELGYCSMCNFSLTTTSDRPLNTAALEYAADNGIRVGEAIAYVEGSAEWCFENGYDICHIAYPWRPKEGVTV